MDAGGEGDGGGGVGGAGSKTARYFTPSIDDD